MNPDPVSCKHSLIALSSAPAAELVGDSPLARHVAKCPDCSRVAQVVLERERSKSLGLDPLTRGGDPALVDDTAMIAEDRHRTGRFVTWLLIGALVVTAWFALNSVLGPLEREPRATVTETIQFSCLPSQDAERLIEPYLRSNGSIAYLPPAGFRGLTVRGTSKEIATAASLIAKVDLQMKMAKNPACDAEVTPLPPATPKP